MLVSIWYQYQYWHWFDIGIVLSIFENLNDPSRGVTFFPGEKLCYNTAADLHPWHRSAASPNVFFFFFFLLHHCDWTSGSRSSVVSLPCIHNNNNYYYYVKRIASLIESVWERPGWSWKFTCSINLSHHQITAGCGCWPQWLKGSDAAILALAKFVIVLWFCSLFRCLMKVWG